GRLQATLKGHTVAVRDVAFSPDGKVLVSVANDKDRGRAKLWDVLTGEAYDGVNGGELRINSAAFLAHGKSVVLGGEDATGAGWIKMWDTRTRRERVAPWTARGPVLALRSSPDGGSLAVSYDNRDREDVAGAGIQIWDVATARETAHSRTEGAVLSLASSPDGRTLACGGHEETIRCLDVASGKERTPLRSGHRVGSIAISPDGRTLAAAVMATVPLR